MIIDAHCHLWKRDMIPEKYWRNAAWMTSQFAPGNLSVDIILKSEVMQKYMDGSAERLISEMEEAEIDKALVFGTDWGLALGEPKIPIQDFNKFIADNAKEYPDKLIPIFTIDPRRPNAAKLFEDALTKWEMKGLKLHPTTGYYPDGEKCYKIFEIADKYQVPIVTHSGYLTGLKGHTASLDYFDAPTTDFPDINFSFAHLGFGKIDEIVGMMYMKPNVFCDISAHGQLLMMNSPTDFYRQMRFIMNHHGVSNKVMFGSDWPATSSLMPLSRWVETIQTLKNQKITDILDKFGYSKFKIKEINQILGKNATAFLNLKL